MRPSATPRQILIMVTTVTIQPGKSDTLRVTVDAANAQRPATSNDREEGRFEIIQEHGEGGAMGKTGFSRSYVSNGTRWSMRRDRVLPRRSSEFGYSGCHENNLIGIH
jgi:hypothetical protein